MKYRNQIALLLMAALFALPGCNVLMKAAKGGKITSADLVNEAERSQREKEKKQKRIAQLNEAANEDLKKIEDLRKNGKFSSAGYREKRFNKILKELGTLDPKHKMLTAGPKQLEQIKATHTEEVYAKNVLVGKCKSHADAAKKSRMEEKWRYVRGNLTAFVKCRRQLLDKKVDPSVIKEQDELAIAEFDGLFAHDLKQAEDYRKAKKFRYASGMETSIEDRLRYYKEIKPDSEKPKEVMASLTKIRKTYRDPEEVKAEQAKSAFTAWKGNVQKIFNGEWNKIQSAEAKAKPAFDAATKAAEAGDKKTAIAKFLEARKTLYAAAYPSAVALETAYNNGNLERGMSYEIAAGLAKIYFESGDKTKLYPELSLIKTGRSWVAQDQELQVRLYDILADRKGKMVPKPTDLVRRYAGRYSDEGRKFKGVKEIVSAKKGEAYNLMGVNIETISHRTAGYSTEKNIGKTVFIKDQTVTTSAKGNLRFDFRGEYKEAYACKSTGRISSVNAYTGRVYYEKKCKYRTRKTGYILHVKTPRGVKVKKGDKVTLYANVQKKRGKFDVLLNKAGFVRVSSGGSTQWFLGVKTK